MSAPSGLDAVVVGAGDRGYDAYATWYLDHPDRGRVVAVADPDPGRRSRFAERYNLPANRCFASDAELFTQPQLAPLALVMTGDTYHVTPTVRALEAGYDVLLEKPVALDVAGCAALLDAAERTGNVVAVCHVYRFAHVFAALHEVVRSGALGEIVSIQLSENVAFWHYAHSYVRGLTRNSAVPMLLQKSCHDLDLLAWLAGSASMILDLVASMQIQITVVVCLLGCVVLSWYFYPIWSGTVIDNADWSSRMWFSSWV